MIGSSSGTKIRKMEMPSRNMPTVISSRISSAITPYSPRPESTMALATGSITPSVDSENAKMPASDTTSRITADSSPATLGRSEEHTSELQSHLNLVCRLLLEKKKKQKTKPQSMSDV